MATMNEQKQTLWRSLFNGSPLNTGLFYLVNEVVSFTEQMQLFKCMKLNVKLKEISKIRNADLFELENCFITVFLSQISPARSDQIKKALEWFNWLDSWIKTIFASWINNIVLMDPYSPEEMNNIRRVLVEDDLETTMEDYELYVFSRQKVATKLYDSKEMEPGLRRCITNLVEATKKNPDFETRSGVEKHALSNYKEPRDFYEYFFSIKDSMIQSLDHNVLMVLMTLYKEIEKCVT